MAARLATPQIALAQAHPMALGERHQLDDRPVNEPGIRRVSNRLRLNSGVDHHPLEILGLDCSGVVRHRQALLDQGRELLLPETLAPARQ